MRCMNMRKLYEVDPSVCGVEMDIARADYEFAMNRAYFDANMLNRTNFNVFRALKVPLEAFPRAPAVPACGTVPVDMPPGRFKQRLSYCNHAAFLGYPVAVQSLQGVIRENTSIRSFRLLDPIHDKTLTLDKYERAMVDQMINATRAVKVRPHLPRYLIPT